MGELFRYIKRNIFLSAKSVFFSIKHYAWFIAALMMIQCFFCTMTIAAFNNNEVQQKLLADEYDYHMIIGNINEKQYYILLNDNSVRYESNKFFDITRTVRKGAPGTLDPKYDLYIYLKFNADESYEKFMNHFNESLTKYGDTEWEITKTALLDFSSYRSTNTMYYMVAFVLLTVFGVLIMYALYYIRTSYFKFTYGIFMTFGGGYKKIYSTSFWEMMVVALLALIPSCVLSTELLRVFYSARGISLNVHSSAYFISAAISLVITALALIVPCKRISRKTPISNLIADDNSDKVTSPRISSEFFRVDIPRKYALVSVWRFRRHNAVLAITAALFTSAFVLIFYGTSLYCDSITVDRPEYTLHFDDNSYANEMAQKNNKERLDALKPEFGTGEVTEIDEDELYADDTEEIYDYEAKPVTEAVTEAVTEKVTEPVTEEDESAETEIAETDAVDPADSEETPDPLAGYNAPTALKANYSFTTEMEKAILALDGISRVEKSGPALNTPFIYHFLVKEESIENKFEYTTYPDDSEYGIFMNADFRPHTWKNVKQFFHSEYEGDIYDLPEDAVIVTNYVDGKKVFDFKVGDRIKVAQFLGIIPNANVPKDENNLIQLLDYYNFDYITLTVAAVVEDLPDSTTPVAYVHKSVYEKLCGDDNTFYIGQSGTCRDANIYVDASLTSDERNALEARLSDMFAVYANATVIANHAGTQEHISNSRGVDVVFYSIAILTALIAPLVIMFSQSMFNIKREDEFDVITALGIERKKVLGILLTESGIETAATLAVYLVVTAIASLILHAKMNSWLGTAIVYRMPLWQIGAGMLLIVIPKLLAALISYFSFLRGHRHSYRINLDI